MQLKFQKKVKDYLFERLEIIEVLLTDTELSGLTQLLTTAEEAPDSLEFTADEYASVRAFFRAVLDCNMVVVQSILWNQYDDESIQNAMDKFYLHFNV